MRTARSSPWMTATVERCPDNALRALSRIRRVLSRRAALRCRRGSVEPLFVFRSGLAHRTRAWTFRPSSGKPPRSLSIVRSLMRSRRPASGAASARACSRSSAEPAGLSLYRLELVPRLWRATQRAGLRIFQHLSIPDIVMRLLTEWAITSEWRIDRARYPKLEFKVQYEETDCAFMCRLLEEAGITFLFEEGDSEVRLVLADAPHARKQRAAPVPCSRMPAPAARPEHVQALTLGRDLRSDTLVLFDYDFRRAQAIRAEALGRWRCRARRASSVPAGLVPGRAGQKAAKLRSPTTRASRAMTTAMVASKRGGFSPRCATDTQPPYYCAMQSTSVLAPCSRSRGTSTRRSTATAAQHRLRSRRLGGRRSFSRDGTRAPG